MEKIVNGTSWTVIALAIAVCAALISSGGWTQQAADTDGKAIFNLGYLCEQGIGTAADLSLAIRLYLKASEMGYEKADAAFDRLVGSSRESSGN